MADLYSSIGGNARNVKVGSQLGTPALQLIEIAAIEDSSAVDFTKFDLAGAGVYTTSGSLMSKAVLALQGFAEVYIVGTPSTGEFVVAVNANTANRDVDNDGVDWTSAENAIDSAIGIGTGTHSVTITQLTLTGDDLT